MNDNNTKTDPDPERDLDLDLDADTDTESGTEPERTVTIDVEGRQLVEETVETEKREQYAENAQAESTRQRLLKAKEKREQQAEPFEMTFEAADPTSDAELDPLLIGETIEFRPFPKDLKNAFQEASLEFAGVDEESLTGEPARKIKEMNERIVDALALYSTDDELDTDFWRNMTDIEDRQIIAGQLLAEQGK